MEPTVLRKLRSMFARRLRTLHDKAFGTATGFAVACCMFVSALAQGACMLVAAGCCFVVEMIVTSFRSVLMAAVDLLGACLGVLGVGKELLVNIVHPAITLVADTTHALVLGVLAATRCVQLNSAKLSVLFLLIDYVLPYDVAGNAHAAVRQAVAEHYAASVVVLLVWVCVTVAAWQPAEPYPHWE